MTDFVVGGTYFLLLFLLLLGFLLNDVHQAALQGFLVLRQSVLLPGVVEDLWVKVVALHAPLEETSARLVVGFFFKLERPAVLHEFHELSRLIFA